MTIMTMDNEKLNGMIDSFSPKMNMTIVALSLQIFFKN